MNVQNETQTQVALLVEDRQQATILAALRHYQEALIKKESGALAFKEISSREGELDPLSEQEIDDLCEVINSGTAPDVVQSFIDWLTPHKAAFTRLVEAMLNQGWRPTRVFNGEYWSDLSVVMTPDAIYKNYVSDLNCKIVFSHTNPSKTGRWKLAPKQYFGLNGMNGSDSFLDATMSAMKSVLGS